MAAFIKKYIYKKKRKQMREKKIGELIESCICSIYFSGDNRSQIGVPIFPIGDGDQQFTLD